MMIGRFGHDPGFILYSGRVSTRDHHDPPQFNCSRKLSMCIAECSARRDGPR
jgi:hypothetical protein